MDIIEALKSEFLRVSGGDKWLVFDEEKWIVYQRKFGAKRTHRLIETTDQEAAVAELLKDD